MLDLIINDEEIRLLFYAVAFLFLTLAAEKYIEKNITHLTIKKRARQNEKCSCKKNSDI